MIGVIVLTLDKFNFGNNLNYKVKLSNIIWKYKK
jgi:hypothetical protein